MVASAELMSMTYRQWGERPARRVPHRVRTRYRFASRSASSRGSIPPPTVARRSPSLLFHVKHGPCRPGRVRIRRAYRYRAPCQSRPCRIATRRRRRRHGPQTTHAVQRRRVGWRPGHTPPLREPQKRRAASLRRKSKRSYGSPVTEPSTTPPSRQQRMRGHQNRPGRRPVRATPIRSPAVGTVLRIERSTLETSRPRSPRARAGPLSRRTPRPCLLRCRRDVPLADHLDNRRRLVE